MFKFRHNLISQNTPSRSTWQFRSYQKILHSPRNPKCHNDDVKHTLRNHKYLDVAIQNWTAWEAWWPEFVHPAMGLQGTNDKYANREIAKKDPLQAKDLGSTPGSSVLLIFFAMSRPHHKIFILLSKANVYNPTVLTGDKANRTGHHFSVTLTCPIRLHDALSHTNNWDCRKHETHLAQVQTVTEIQNSLQIQYSGVAW